VVAKNGSATINVLANDRDNDGTINPASVHVVLNPSVGTAVVQPNGSIVYTPPTNFVGEVSFNYTVNDAQGATSNAGLVSIRVVNSFFQNQSIAMDVNADGFVSPIDALLIVNELNLNGTHPLPPAAFTPPPFWDTNGDGQIAPLDALLVINFLNARGVGGEGEGEMNGPAGFAELDAQPAQNMDGSTRVVVNMLTSTQRENLEQLAIQQDIDQTYTDLSPATDDDGRLVNNLVDDLVGSADLKSRGDDLDVAWDEAFSDDLGDWF
jgi:hypothetical protein